ncbi:Glycosyltransferase involved in cell wall bisynthesis [Sphingobium sp. YR657]|uniref:glycosyltransferase n=1 Tax=Sphingobium TaxID=165695 RepID=UPI0009107129|nr:glycosyltransferase [Sphingobium sp. YR657]SHM67522.1 Glycosyltransferase involved in cell wall bisynthesis [Sphingobium sp. YR657]
MIAPLRDPSSPAVKVFFCPVSQKSLYVELTFGSLGEQYEPVFREQAGLAEAIDCLSATIPALVHVQWEEFFFDKVKGAEEANAITTHVEGQLKKVLELGGRIVWTIHNELPHHGKFLDQFLRLRSRLSALASRIVVHNVASLTVLGEQTGLNRADPRIRLVPHPSYAGMYEPEGRAAAEVQSSAPATGDKIILGFGTMRAQKGFDSLLSNLEPRFMQKFGLRFRFSGQGSEGSRLQARFRRDDIDWDLCYVPREQVPRLFRSAACVVLPYTRVMTSGVALLGLTLGAVLVAPALPTFRELLPRSLHRFLYDPNDPTSMKRVIRRVVLLSAEEARAVRQAGLSVADALHPNWVSAMLGDIYMDLVSELFTPASVPAEHTKSIAQAEPGDAPPAIVMRQPEPTPFHPPSTHERPFFWRKDKSLGNFGDALTLVFLDRLFDGDCLYPSHSVHLIGSVITPARLEAVRKAGRAAGDENGRALFWGCGKKDGLPLDQSDARRCIFLGTRGILTRDALGLPRSTPLGDPALLLPRFYSPKHDAAVSGKVLWVPHVHYGNPTERDLDGCPAHVVMSPSIPNTADACERFIDAIISARFVMANAMHAAAVALAYGVPFAFWPGDGINVPFKWRDLISPLGMELDFHRTYASGHAAYERMRPDRAFASLDLQALLDVAPYRLKASKLR